MVFGVQGFHGGGRTPSPCLPYPGLIPFYGWILLPIESRVQPCEAAHQHRLHLLNRWSSLNNGMMVLLLLCPVWLFGRADTTTDEMEEQLDVVTKERLLALDK